MGVLNRSIGMMSAVMPAFPCKVGKPARRDKGVAGSGKIVDNQTLVHVLITCFVPFLNSLFLIR